MPLPRLSEMLGGPPLYIKRDDLSGLALGGNKTRKLEYLFADALAQGCDSVITGGAAQSNHCRQTAAGAAATGLACHLVLGGEAPEKSEGNLLIDELCGAQLHFAGEKRKGEDIPRIVEELRREGARPYAVPYGGSNVLGAASFVNALLELDRQLLERELNPQAIVFASSSGGTHAGLALGAQQVRASMRIVGIAIDKEDAPRTRQREKIVELMRATAERLEVDAPHPQIELRDEFLGDGYGVVGEAEKQALSTLARAEGILLDPVYTARAFAGLLGLLKAGEFEDPTAPVIFWHTGGHPALFAPELGPLAP